MGWITPRFPTGDPRNCGHYPRRFVWKVRQGAPENKKPTHPLLDGRFWRRHLKPFAKTERGKERRAERRFVLRQHHGAIE